MPHDRSSSSQSDQLGFLEGIVYSTSSSVNGSSTEMRLDVCSLNTILPLSSESAKYGLLMGSMTAPDALPYDDMRGRGVVYFVYSSSNALNMYRLLLLVSESHMRLNASEATPLIVGAPSGRSNVVT